MKHRLDVKARLIHLIHITYIGPYVALYPLTGWDDMRCAGPRLPAHAVGGVAEQRAVVLLGPGEEPHRLGRGVGPRHSRQLDVLLQVMFCLVFHLVTANSHDFMNMRSSDQKHNYLIVARPRNYFPKCMFLKLYSVHFHLTFDSLVLLKNH